LGKSNEIEQARKAIRLCELSPFEIVQIQDELTGCMPNKSYFNSIAHKNRIKVITTRKTYRQRESDSISNLKHHMMKQRLKTELSDSKLSRNEWEPTKRDTARK
jgi:hypothetical protein